MRLPWQRRQDEHVDPYRPHPFQSKSDSGIGALAPIGGGVGRQVADIASASAYTRTIGCAVPGCGKPRDALIHAPED